MADGTINRRKFIQNTAIVAAGSAALSSNALSYDRILGANDRILLGHIGVGVRGSRTRRNGGGTEGQEERGNVSSLRPVEPKPRAGGGNQHQVLRQGSARPFQHAEELIAFKDLDAIIISTPEHSHSLILKKVAEAGKDGYCEKPMGNVLEEVKAARDVVQAKNLIVQIGTQHRSEPYQKGGIRTDS